MIARRLDQVPASLASWRRTIEALAERGELPSRRHVLGVAEQAATYATGTFGRLSERVAPGLEEDSELARAARRADGACGELSRWLTDVVAPRAGEIDACGLERYERLVEELQRRGSLISRSSTPGAGKICVASTRACGNSHPSYCPVRRVSSRSRTSSSATPRASCTAPTSCWPSSSPLPSAASRSWTACTSTSIRASGSVTRASRPRVRPRRRITSDRARTSRGPGTTWFPTLGATTFSWWSIPSTWYHEGVPGHHLQGATSILEADRQSRFHRLEAWTSGYGEGWALYAERLMDELGFFEDPGRGDGLSLEPGVARGARHGRHWSALAVAQHRAISVSWRASATARATSGLAEMAVAVLDQRALQPHEMSVSEVERYLGMPAQAISYKVGERTWMRAREDARTRLGRAFSLKRFHAYALALGPLGLDALEEELRQLGRRLTSVARDVPLMVEQVVQGVAHERLHREAAAVRARAGA